MVPWPVAAKPNADRRVNVIDALTSMGFLTSGVAVDLKRNLTNWADEKSFLNYLSERAIVSAENINRAYAKLWNVPYLELPDQPDLNALQLFPKSICAEYHIIPFKHDGSNIAVAVADPTRVRENQPGVLSQLGAKSSTRYNLSVTSPKSFARWLAAYPETKEPAPKPVSPPPAPVLPPRPPATPAVPPPLPPLQILAESDIDRNVLKKVPLELARRFRFVVYHVVALDKLKEPQPVKIVSPSEFQQYDVAAEYPSDPHLVSILKFIESHNHIRLVVHRTDGASIDRALKLYEEEKKPPLLPPKEEEKLLSPPKPLTPPAAPPVKPAPPPLPKSPPPPLAPPEPPLVTPPVESKGFWQFIRRLFGGKSKEGILKNEVISSPPPKPAPPTPIPHPQPPLSAPHVTEKPAQAPPIKPVVTPPASASPVPSKPTAPAPFVMPTLKASGEDVVKKDEDEETEDDLGALLEKDVESVEELEQIIKEGFVPRIVAAIVSYAITLRASDVHIEAAQKDVRVRFRIDGMLQDVARLPIEQHAAVISRVKILSKLKIDETRIPQDGRFDVVFKNREVDLRVSSMPTVHGEKVVMRILDKTHGIMSLEEIGLVGHGFDVVLAAIKKPYGIVLSTGPTGSGKSTTLYAILNRISVPAVNVITLEDPVEYEIAGVNQAQIKPKIGFTFAEGLRSVLRQDPNIVMVGEIRDAETASMATHAALTGHLVLSTLHTNDAPGALPRLINMGIEPFLITSSINCVEAQRLIRKVCQNCKEEIKLPDAVVKEIEEELAKIPANNQKDRDRITSPMKFYHGKGCDRCQSGYKGRIGMYEVMNMSEEIETIAINKGSANEIQKQAIKEGMITMKQDGLLKALAGLTTVDEVFRESSV